MTAIPVQQKEGEKVEKTLPSSNTPVSPTNKNTEKSVNFKLIAAIVGVLILLAIGTVGYLNKEKIIALFKTESTTLKPQLSEKLKNATSVIYIPAAPELTAEQWQVLMKSNYDVTIFEQKVNYPANYLKDYALNHFIAIHVTAPELLSENEKAYSNHYYVTDTKSDICPSSELKCGTFQEEQAVNLGIANTEFDRQLSGKKKTKFITEGVRPIYYLNQSCSVTELATCQKQLLIQAESFRNSTEIEENSLFSITIVGSEGQILDPFISPLPEPKLSTKIDQIPVFLWTPGTSSPSYAQTAYSIAVNEKSANTTIFKSGKINGTNLGDYYLPRSEPNTNEFTMYLKVWYTYGSISIETASEAKIDFTFDYKAVEVGSESGSVQQMAWIPDWGMARGIESFKKNPKKWSTISPVWWALNGDGSLTAERSMNHAELLSLAKKNGVTVIPTVSQFDPDVMEDMLNNHMEVHIQTILALVRNNNYAGIDLDYESTYLKDKELFQQFITRLASELHKENKILIFTVLPKWTDEKINNFLPQTKQVQDWEFLGKHVDEVRIMGYDFTGEGSYVAGPISPIIWNELIIKYALTKLPPEKIVLALPLYSHAWLPSKESDPAGPNNDKVINSGNSGTQSIQHAEINELKRTNKSYSEALDPWAYEVRAEFNGTKGKYVMYYLDKNAINKRLELAKKYKIKGIIYWRIGGEEL